MGLRITTWNVNGIRNPFAYQPWREKRTYQAMFDVLETDIMIMQETKIQRKDLKDDMVLVPGWDVYFSLPKHKKGYSGVAIYTRNSRCAPIRAEEGILGVLSPPRTSTMFRNLPENQQIGGYPTPGQLTGNVDELTLDSEGRCVVLEFPGFVLLGVYSPANRDESRDDFRTEYFEAIDVRVRNLIAMGKEVILTGDLNVIRSALDTSNLSDSLRKHDMTMDEWLSLPTRRVFNQLIHGGQVRGLRDEGRPKPVMWDLTRDFHPDRQGMNTCWDTKKNTRPANNGSRIDYILCSDGLKKWFSDANIQEGLMGSDHCPVFAVFTEALQSDGKTEHVSDLVNPSDMMSEGQRLRPWSQKDLLPLSARLIPEFDGRRSIRDMFSKGGVAATKPQSTEIEQKSPTNPGTTHITAQTVSATPKDTPNSAKSALDPLKSSVRSPQQAVTLKRPIQLIESTAKPPKRSKPLSTTSKGKTESGQKTLQGFFRPKESTIRADVTPEREKQPTTTPPSANISSGALTSVRQVHRMQDVPPTASMSSPRRPHSASTESVSTSATALFDPIEAKESWSKLLGKRVVPRCEHNEPCISLLTKKPGVNCGRSFYICPRPLGPSGEKESNSEWRCGTFIWSSDWNGTAT